MTRVPTHQDHPKQTTR